MGYLEEIRQQGRAANPFFLLMGIELRSFGNGKAELSMLVRPDMLNGAGWLQGGLYTALCDEAMALALFTSLKEGECIATISESTSYLQGVKSGKIVAIAKVTKKARQVAFTEGYVRKETDDGTILSQSRASFMILGNRQQDNRHIKFINPHELEDQDGVHARKMKVISAGNTSTGSF
jgi:acyl-CoA thioesterase